VVTFSYFSTFSEGPTNNGFLITEIDLFWSFRKLTFGESAIIHYSDSESPSLCYSLHPTHPPLPQWMMSVSLRSKNYKLSSLSSVWPDRDSNPRSTALEVSTLTIITWYCSTPIVNFPSKLTYDNFYCIKYAFAWYLTFLFYKGQETQIGDESHITAIIFGTICL
jgi:hypothetical protein